MLQRINGWLPVVLGAAVVILVVVSASILAGLGELDKTSVTFVLGGALGWAGGQRPPIRIAREGEPK